MEMEEHPQLEEARQPPHRPLRTSAFTPRCMVGVWRSMVGMGSAQWWAAVKPTRVAPLDTSLGNPINSLSRPCYRCQPSYRISLRPPLYVWP